ncbi:hypothetical protein G7062_06225 [Erysipelothrix sp. HDW6C]|uniref:hypothetical protein n=1 Tax=Erysipelothrix sp. HDW6C TaxID=2714930 RepID=UPI00140AFB9B|nr:hypothetical protein [Erysipelothrix sp. HDW6C]QIK69912.1 hypothetical protein G7062_06225 [Erysipelothrix sp. HDW6C]
MKPIKHLMITLLMTSMTLLSVGAQEPNEGEVNPKREENFSTMENSSANLASAWENETIGRIEDDHTIAMDQESNSLKNTLQHAHSSYEGEEESVYFETPALESIVRDELRIPADQPITAQDMLNLRGITITEGGHYSLVGMEYAKQFINFSVSVKDNAVVTLDDISPLQHTNLFYFALYSPTIIADESQLYLLPAASMKTVKFTDTAMVQDYSFVTGLKELTRVEFVNDAERKELDVSFLHDLPKLSSFKLKSVNFGTTLNVDTLPKLWDFTLENTDVQSLYFINETSELRGFTLRENAELTDPSRAAFATKVQSIQLTQSPITNIDFMSTLVNLETAFLFDNEIEDITGVYGVNGGNTKLTYLQLTNNKIKDASVMGRMKFPKSTDGYEAAIFLNKNQIEDISFLDTIEFDEDTAISLSYNKITDFTPMQRFDQNTKTIISAMAQIIDVGDTYSNIPMALNMLKPMNEDKSQFIYSYEDVVGAGDVERGAIEVMDDYHVMFPTATPQDDEFYNTFYVYSYDYMAASSGAISTPQIAHSTRATANVLGQPTLTSQKTVIEYYIGSSVTEAQFLKDIGVEILNDSLAQAKLLSDFNRIDFDVLSENEVTVSLAQREFSDQLKITVKIIDIPLVNDPTFNISTDTIDYVVGNPVTQAQFFEDIGLSINGDATVLANFTDVDFNTVGAYKVTLTLGLRAIGDTHEVTVNIIPSSNSEGEEETDRNTPVLPSTGVSQGFAGFGVVSLGAAFLIYNRLRKTQEVK